MPLRLRPLLVPSCLLLAACAPAAPAKPVEAPAPSASAPPPAASSAPAVKAPPPPAIGVLATIEDPEGLDVDHGRPGSVVARGADGSIRVAHGFLRATAPKGGNGDFVLDAKLDKAPYSPLNFGTASLSWDTVFWNAPFLEAPIATRWETIERVGQFATVATLEGGSWRVLAKDTAYLDVVARGGAAPSKHLTLQIDTPHPTKNCSFEDDNCPPPKGKPARFVDVGDPKAVTPTLPKNFCPDALRANARGDLWVLGADCTSDTPQAAYYAPGANTATVSAVPGRFALSLALHEDGTLFVASTDTLVALAPGAAPKTVDAPLGKGGAIDAIALDGEGALWLATHDAAGAQDAPAGRVLKKGKGAESWEPVSGPWSAAKSTCAIIAFDVSDGKDPLFLGQNCSAVKKAAKPGEEPLLVGTIDVLGFTTRKEPQRLPSLLARIRAHEAARPRVAVTDPAKCDEKLATVVIPAEKKADAAALLTKQKRVDELEVRDATLAGKPAVVIASPFNPTEYSPKGAAALAKLFRPLGATLVCGVPPAGE